MAIEKRFASEEYVSNLIGTGGGSQADWNQNDETASDFVKNRPFWTSDPVETVIVEETTFELQEGIANIACISQLEVGKEYITTLDGSQYNCVCKELMGVPCIGNLSLLGMGGDTEEPFAVVQGTNISLGIMINSEVIEHTISIVGYLEPIYQIDEKYIPILPTSKVKNTDLFCIDLVGFLTSVDEGYTIVDSHDLPNDIRVYAVHPSLDFRLITKVGMLTGVGVGIFELRSVGTYFFNIGSYSIEGKEDVVIRYREIVYVRSDNIEAGIAEYKKAHGIE